MNVHLCVQHVGRDMERCAVRLRQLRLAINSVLLLQKDKVSCRSPAKIPHTKSFCLLQRETNTYFVSLAVVNDYRIAELFNCLLRKFSFY